MADSKLRSPTFNKIINFPLCKKKKKKVTKGSKQMDLERRIIQ